jgi:hypothetical protein
MFSNWIKIFLLLNAFFKVYKSDICFNVTSIDPDSYNDATTGCMSLCSSGPAVSNCFSVSGTIVCYPPTSKLSLLVTNSPTAAGPTSAPTTTPPSLSPTPPTTSPSVAPTEYSALVNGTTYFNTNNYTDASLSIMFNGVWLTSSQYSVVPVLACSFGNNDTEDWPDFGFFNIQFLVDGSATAKRSENSVVSIDNRRKKKENVTIYVKQELFPWGERYDKKIQEVVVYENIKRSEEKTDLAQVFVNWVQPTLIVTTGVNYPVQVWTSKPDYNLLSACISTCSFTVPDNYFETPLDFTVTVYDNGTMIFDQTYPVNVYQSCPIPGNPFSPVWVQTWNCASTLGQFIIVAGIFGIIFMIILVVFLIVVGCCASWKYKMLCNPNAQINTNIYNDDRDIMLDTVNPRTSNWLAKFMQSQNGLNMTNGQMVILILLILPALISSQTVAMTMCNTTLVTGPQPVYNSRPCSSTFTMSSNSLVCLGTSCTIRFSYAVTFAALGQTVCLNFVDSTGNIVTTMSLFWKTQVSLGSLAFQYATTDWKGVGESYYACYDTSDCNQDKNVAGTPSCYTQALNRSAADRNPCSAFINTWNVPRPMPLLDAWCRNAGSSSLQIIPNFACQSSPGVVGCGWPTVPSCLYTYYDLTPTGQSYNVFTIPNLNTYPIIEAVFFREGAVDANNNPCFDSYVNVSFASVVNNIPTFIPSMVSSGPLSPYTINVVIQSAVVRSTQIFGGNTVICTFNNTKCWWGISSPINAPLTGTVGDIQFKNAVAVTNNNRKVWNPSSVITNVLNTIATYTFPPIGSRVLANYPIFPLGIGDTFYSIIPNGISGLVQNPGPLTLGIATTVPFLVTYKTSVVCPKMQYVSTSGCYVCAAGAVVTISASSTCASGTIFLSLTGPATLGTTDIYASPQAEAFDIVFYPTSETATYILTGKDVTGLKTSSITWTYTYNQEILLADGNYTIITNGTSNLSSRSFSDWWNSIDIGIKIGFGLGISFGVVAIIALVILGIWISIKITGQAVNTYSAVKNV